VLVGFGQRQIKPLIVECGPVNCGIELRNAAKHGFVLSHGRIGCKCEFNNAQRQADAKQFSLQNLNGRAIALSHK